MNPVTSSVKTSKKQESFYLSGIELFYGAANAFAGYLVIFMKNCGFDPSQIGVITAINAAVVIFSNPLWGVLSDRIRSVKKVFLMLLIIAGITYPSIALTSHIPGIGKFVMLPVIVIAGFFWSPILNIMDSLVVDASNRHKLNYGMLRGLNSISYAVMCIICSFILPFLGIEAVFYLLPLFVLLTFVTGLKVPDQESAGQKRSFKELKFKELLGNYRYITFLIFAVLLYFSFSSELTYLPYILERVNIDTALIGRITGYRAFVEAAVLFLVVYIKKHVPLQYMLIGAAAFYALDAFLITIVPNLSTMMVTTTLFGIGSGLLFGSATNYCYSLAPDSLKSTAITLYSSTCSLAGIFASFVGGQIIEAFGVAVLFRICSGVLITAVVYYTITLVAKKR